MLRVGGVMVLWLAAVACEGWDWEDQEGSGSWGPAPGPAPEPWYHCGAENGSALCLPGRVPNGGEGRSYHSEDCDSQCSMYKCSGLGSDLQCIPDPFGTYATRTDCETGCHLYRCDGVQCIQDDVHGTYFKEVRPTASPRPYSRCLSLQPPPAGAPPSRNLTRLPRSVELRGQVP